jgi:hypothetical protein
MGAHEGYQGGGGIEPADGLSRHRLDEAVSHHSRNQAPPAGVFHARIIPWIAILGEKKELNPSWKFGRSCHGGRWRRAPPPLRLLVAPRFLHWNSSARRSWSARVRV